LYEIGPNDFIYYATYYEGNCGVEAQDVYVEDVDLGDNPLEDCPDECVITSRKSQHYGPDDMPRIDHYTKKIFPGYNPALAAAYAPRWAAGVSQVGSPVYKRINLVKEGRTYKAKVFELRLSASKTIYIAFEIESFPSSEHPGTIASNSAKRCVGQHAYSMKYNGKGMLFFVDVDG
jgi:hypothetical protein